MAKMGERRFGRWNWLGMKTLAWREVLRFATVWQQTLLAPLITAGLFLTVFALAFGRGRADVMGVPYLHFLAPGILMMTVIQNAFANTSSSILIAKVQGNIVDTLMPPLSATEVLLGYLAGAIVRALCVGLLISAGVGVTLGLWPTHPLWLVLVVVLGAALMGSLGIAAAIWANKFDQMAAITNFIVTPLSFLSGTFYSASVLPPLFYALTHWNPVFYLIDGARFGMIGASDASPVQGLAVIALFVAAVMTLCWYWLKTGFRMKA
ncbi:ABC transporter permease [Thioclava sp. A2]|uniref:ABC transporter permease n=1 Tax=Thioclava sp. FCG-A2 TaxID=3080562 RepID=UPI002953D112|nr:ABC transporter permease [Thioclava sp. A2]MDV7271472.1 ABC transporter permease [Thioclava sp. A2]